MATRRVLQTIDAAAVIAVFVVSLSLGAAVLADVDVNMISYTLPIAAMEACGQGLAAPGAISPEFAAFARRERASTSCAAVIGVSPPRAPDSFSLGYRYAVYSVAAAIRIGGLSWTTLDRYVAMLFAVSMALTYLLYRLLAGPVLALAGVGAIVFSNHVLALALDLRDYGKEIWFAALWLVLGWLLARGLPRVSRAVYLPSCLAGVVLGIGLGFRMDLMVFLPAFLAVIAFALAGWSRRALATKAIAAGVFLASFGVAATPILTTLGGGSNLPHFAVLGLSASFTDALGLDRPAYDLGALYADGFAHSLTAAHAVVAKNERDVGNLYSKLYDRQGTALLRDVVWNFPADVIARGLGATRQAIAYPFDPMVRWDVAHVRTLSSGAPWTRLIAWRLRAGDWLRGRELLLMLLAFFAVAVRDVRKAIVGASLVLYFCAYSLIQFHHRHTFHLDIIAIALLIVVAGASISALWRLGHELRQGRALGDVAADCVRRVVPALATSLAVLLAGSLGLWLVRTWQQRHVTSLLEATIQARWSDVAVSHESLARFLQQRDEPLTQWFANDIRVRDPQQTGDWWQSAVLLRVADAGAGQTATDDRGAIRASYMQVELGGARCAVGAVPIAALYSSDDHTIDADYTRAFYVAVRNATEPSRLLQPVLELPGHSRFEGFAVAANAVDCVRRVQRATPPEAIPMPIVFAALTDTWRSTPLFQRVAASAAPAKGWDVPGLYRHQEQSLASRGPR
jgi:hypothetical protein